MAAVRVVLLLIPGIIHLLPLSGVLGGQRLMALYGIEINDPNLLIMMQHRAVLFGILGLFLIISAVRSELQRPAIIAGLISTLSFIAIALWVGGYNELIQRVIVADVIAIACLLGAVAMLPGKASTKPPQ